MTGLIGRQALGPCRVAVLAGGNSDERAISLQSGESVHRALCGRGHSATAIDPADIDLAGIDWESFDVAFLALHGREGEDGTVQSILDGRDVAYTGSDAAASRLAFRKSASKERFALCGVPTPAYTLIHVSDTAARIKQQAQKLGYPLVVKPDAQGSSLGVSVIHTPDELPGALTRCFHYEGFGILEQAILGTEWTLGLLDERILPLIEIKTSRPFFDYYAKYEDDATTYHFDFDLPEEVIGAIETAGMMAAKALATRGLARVDLRVDRSLKPWVLEVNTIPGMTSHSLVPKAAARAGIDFGELCEAAIQSALASSADRAAEIS